MSPLLITPLSGSISPSKSLRSVDFPAPFFPTIAMVSFCKILVEKSLISSLSPRDLVTCSSSKSTFFLLTLSSRLKCFFSLCSCNSIFLISAGFFLACSRSSSTLFLRPSLRLTLALTPRLSHSSSCLRRRKRFSCCFCKFCNSSSFWRR